MDKCPIKLQLPVKISISSDGRVAKIGRLLWSILIHLSCIVLFLIVVPIFLTLTLPLYLYRFGVKTLAKIQRPDLGKMVPTRSAMFAVDDIYSQPLMNNASRIICEGECDFQRIVNLIDANWLQSTLSNSNDWKYPELKQHITVWNGFHFWKNDDQFSVHNHVKLYSNKKPGNFVNLEEVNEFWNEMSMKPFDAGRSPWELTVVPFFQDGIDLDSSDTSSYSSRGSSSSPMSMSSTKSVIIFRWHHALCDGFSVLNLLNALSNLNMETVAKTSNAAGSRPTKQSHWIDWVEWFWDQCVFTVRMPYLTTKLLAQRPDENAWHLPEDKLTRYWHLGIGDGIPITVVHDVKNSLDVKFTSVLLAGLTSAMREVMLKDIQFTGQEKKIPEHVTCGLPFPVANHPDKLRNHWAICTTRLPVGEENPFKRLRIINQNIVQLQKSHLPTIAYRLAPFIGGLPVSLIKVIASNRVSSLICSIMPGPPEILQNFMGKTVLDSMYVNGCGPGRGGFAFSAFTFSGWVKFTVAVDSALSPTSALANDLMKAVETHLLYLHETMTQRVTA